MTDDVPLLPDEILVEHVRLLHPITVTLLLLEELLEHLVVEFETIHTIHEVVFGQEEALTSRAHAFNSADPVSVVHHDLKQTEDVILGQNCQAHLVNFLSSFRAGLDCFVAVGFGYFMKHDLASALPSYDVLQTIIFGGQ